MRFNPKARLDSSRISDGGRGGGMSGGPMRLPMPGGAKAGGGLGLVLVVLFFVVSTCMNGSGGGGGLGLPGGGSSLPQLDASRMADTDRYDHCKTGEDANKDADCARMAVENSLYNYWSGQFSSGFKASRITTFSGAVDTGCGQATSQVGPFYCPADQGIYLDSTFFSDVLEGQLGGQGGDFVEPYVLAHEYGHHIQNLMGTMGKVRTQQGPESDAVRLELQADCYAGMWASDASDGDGILEHLDRGDIEEALDSARAVGDDRIQQKSGGRVNPDAWTHGSSEQRMNWFMTGFEKGSVEACDTFAARNL